MSPTLEPVIPTPLKDLSPNQEALVYGSVVKVEPARQVMVRSRGLRRVQDVRLRDPSGEADLVLWEDEVGMVAMGDQVVIFEGWVKRFRGSICVSLGRYGRLLRLPPSPALPWHGEGPGPTTTAPPPPASGSVRTPARGSSLGPVAVSEPSMARTSPTSVPPASVEVLESAVPAAEAAAVAVDPTPEARPELSLGYKQMIWGLRRQRMRENRNSDGW